MKSNNSLFLIISLLFISISCCQTNEPNEKNDINFLNIKFVSVEGSSNLMPPRAPDPINFTASFEFHNQSEKKTLTDFKVLEIYVFNANNLSIIGKISMYPYPEIILTPGEKKIITFYKERSESKLFEVPCDELLYLKIIIEDQYGNKKELLTENILYSCSA